MRKGLAAAGVISFVTLAYLVGSGQSPDRVVDDNGHHLVVYFPGHVTPPGTRCLLTDTSQSQDALAFWQLDVDGGSLGRAFIAAAPVDGGFDDSLEAPTLPSSYAAFDSRQVEVPCGDAGVWFEFWSESSSQAPPGSCGCGTGCARPDALPVSAGNTYDPGTWAPGDGGVCRWKTCNEMLGQASSMPAECLQ